MILIQFVLWIYLWGLGLNDIVDIVEMYNIWIKEKFSWMLKMIFLYGIKLVILAIRIIVLEVSMYVYNIFWFFICFYVKVFCVVIVLMYVREVRLVLWI